MPWVAAGQAQVHSWKMLGNSSFWALRGWGVVRGQKEQAIADSKCSRSGHTGLSPVEDGGDTQVDGAAPGHVVAVVCEQNGGNVNYSVRNGIVISLVNLLWKS